MRFLLIGAGHIASSHIESINAAGHQCVGVVSKSASASALANRFGIPFSGNSIPEAVGQLRPDGVLILTQPGAFLEIAKILRPFNLPILIEKPLGYSFAEATELKNWLPEKTMVALNRRHYSVAQEAKGLIGTEPLQAVVCIPERFKDFAMRDPVSRDHWPMMNSIHPLDLFFWILGFPTQIGLVEKFGNLNADHSHLSQQTFATYVSDRGHHCRVLTNFSAPGGWRILIFGRDFEIGLDPLEAGYHRTLGGRRSFVPSDDDRNFKPGFVQQIHTFAEGIGSSTQPSNWVSVDSALNSMKWLEVLIPFCDGNLARGGG
jgi:predicted dehydrogenase